MGERGEQMNLYSMSPGPLQITWTLVMGLFFSPHLTPFDSEGSPDSNVLEERRQEHLLEPCLPSTQKRLFVRKEPEMISQGILNSPTQYLSVSPERTFWLPTCGSLSPTSRFRFKQHSLKLTE